MAVVVVEVEVICCVRLFGGAVVVWLERVWDGRACPRGLRDRVCCIDIYRGPEEFKVLMCLVG